MTGPAGAPRLGPSQEISGRGHRWSASADRCQRARKVYAAEEFVTRPCSTGAAQHGNGADGLLRYRVDAAAEGTVRLG